MGPKQGFTPSDGPLSILSPTLSKRKGSPSTWVDSTVYLRWQGGSGAKCRATRLP